MIKIKQHLGNVIVAILLITVISLVVNIINLFFFQYNPYNEFISLSKPEKYMIVDTLIIKEEFISSAEPTPDTDSNDYSVYGHLKNETSKKQYWLKWGRYGDHPWEYFKDSTLKNGSHIRYIPVYKSTIFEGVWAFTDPKYIPREKIYTFITLLFYSLPLWSIPSLFIVFLISYVERKTK